MSRRTSSADGMTATRSSPRSSPVVDYLNGLAGPSRLRVAG